VLVVSAVGLSIAATSLVQLFAQAVSIQWLILAALTLLTGTFTVRIPGINARLSVSDTFVFASALLFGPAAGTITVLLDALIISLRLGHHAREPFRVIFNVSVAALSTWIAAHVFFLVSGIPPYSVVQTPLGQILFPLFLFTLSYFLLNSWLVTFALALEERRKPYLIWRDNFLWLSVNYFGSASVAGLLVAYTRDIDLTTMGIIVPLLLISYLTFKTSLGRIEDANGHLREVNKLYLSTIETLAMAIDAKDQITHGHIRRVQRFAVGLARAVGVNDETQIKAIEAAALLHDMGKLAIPEFILNKPGRLSSNEFNVMKQHANIGADLLSSIQFPYPVVPIVRHHHENWDGSGYPNGLKGVAIPLGARVLSVVDCFDALTSDRPYRPKLPVSEAVRILLERRGSMYDPLVVDKFIEAQPELSEQPTSDVEDREAMESIATRLRLPAQEVPATHGVTGQRLPVETLSFLRSIRPFPSGLSVEDLGLVVSKHLTRLTNASSIAIYCVTENGQSIRCCYADNSVGALRDRPLIPLGERLSGWVVAHRTPIWNSDAALDLNSDLSASSGIAFASSVPLMDGQTVIGALTLYSPKSVEITVEQRLVVQAVAPLLGIAVSAALEHSPAASLDATDVVSREALYSVLDTLLSHRGNLSDPSSSEAISVLQVTFGRSSEPFDDLSRSNLVSRANELGHAITMSDTELIVVVPTKATFSLGLEPIGNQRISAESRRRSYQVREISNSLGLREALGLTFSPTSTDTGKRLIH